MADLGRPAARIQSPLSSAGRQGKVVYPYGSPGTRRVHLLALVLLVGAATSFLIYFSEVPEFGVIVFLLPTVLLLWNRRRIDHERVVLTADRMIYQGPLGRPLEIPYLAFLTVECTPAEGLSVTTHSGFRLRIAKLDRLQELANDLKARAARAGQPTP
jgi:hypothetical protein